MNQEYFAIERVVSIEEVADGAILKCRAGVLGALNLSVRAMTPLTFRVLLSVGVTPRERVSDFVDGTRTCPAKVIRSETEVIIDAGRSSVHIGLSPWHLSFSDGTGRVLVETVEKDRMLTGQEYVPPSGFSARTETGGRPWITRWEAEKTGLSLLFRTGEHIWGCGERFTSLEKRGQKIDIWNVNARGARSGLSYRNVPFYISSSGYGLYLDTPERAEFDFGSRSVRSIVVNAETDEFDCYLISGSAPAEILREYAELTGKPQVPPKWALGLWMSTCFDRLDRSKVEGDTDRMRTLGIPCDVYYFDCFWLRDNHWSDLTWDEERFPAPEKMLAALKQKGYKVCVWENTYISIFSELFAEGSANGYFIRNEKGEPYISNLWLSRQPGTAVLDVTNPDAVAWYQNRHRELMKMGVDAFKTDFGEEIPPDGVYANGRDGKSMHNLYSMLYQKMVFDVVKEVSGRGVIWARSGCAGSKQFPIHWSGDPECTFEDMAAVLRAGLSDSTMGHSLWSHDIGGFYGEPSKELYVRWAQFGLLSPAARCHSQTPRFPWSFDDETISIFRKYARLRYSLIPYIYSCVLEASGTGIPVARPMFLEFPDDESCATLDTQFMLGGDILVAPVFNAEGTVTFYLPEGRWTHLLTDETVVGPRWLRQTVPLELMPVYVRHNALLPREAPASHIDEGDPSELIVSAYMDGTCRSMLRDDAGLIELSAECNDRKITFSPSRAGNWIFHLPRSVMSALPVSVTTPEGPIDPIAAQAGGDVGYWSEEDGLRVRFRGSQCDIRW